MGRVLQRNDFAKPETFSYVGGGGTLQHLPASPVQGEVARCNISQPPLCKGRWHTVPEGLSGERSAWEGAPYGSLYEFANPSVSRFG